MSCHEWENSTQLICQLPPQNQSLVITNASKSSAIAKHLTEWSDILWKDTHTPGNTTKLRLYRLFETTYAIEPYLVIVANSQLRKSLCKFRIGCHQLKIETVSWIPIPSATTNWKTLQTVHSWLCGECDPFLNWMPKVHTFEIIQSSNYNRSDFSHWNQFQASGCRIPQSQLQKHTRIRYSPLIV